MSGIMVMSCAPQQKKPVYPETAKVDTVDVYFGTQVPDPYRWLENDTSAATTAWVEAQNKVTNEYLSQIPFRENLLKRLTELADYEKISAPVKKHGKYYFSKNDGLQNQSVFYVQDSLDGEPRVFLDPNKLSDDGTVALTGLYFSHDGKYTAYTISRSGSDWSEIYVMDTESGKLLGDHIEWAKFTDAAWQGDGFYYSAYDAPTKGKEFSNVNENHKIYYHKIGEPQSKDKLIYQNPAYPKRFYTSGTSEDERILFLTESGAGRGNNLFIRDLKKPAPFISIRTGTDEQLHPLSRGAAVPGWAAPVGAALFCQRLRGTAAAAGRPDLLLFHPGALHHQLCLPFQPWHTGPPQPPAQVGPLDDLSAHRRQLHPHAHVLLSPAGGIDLQSDPVGHCRCGHCHQGVLVPAPVGVHRHLSADGLVDPL